MTAYPVTGTRQQWFDGTIVGYVGHDDEGSLTYVSPREYSDHFFRKYSGWAISEAVLTMLEPHVENVVVYDREQSVAYDYDFEQFVGSASVRIEEEDGDPQQCVPASEAEQRQLDADEVFLV